MICEYKMNLQIKKDKGAVDSAISTINLFKKEHWYLVKSNSPILNGTQAKIWCSNNVFHFEIVIVSLFNQQQIEYLMKDDTLWLKFDNGRYSLSVDYHSTSSFSLQMALVQGYVTITGTFTKIDSTSHSIKDESKYTAILNCSRNNFLGAYFSSCDLEVGHVTHGRRLIELTINTIPIHCYILENNEGAGSSLFIESLKNCEYEPFIKVLHDLTLCLSYITGAFIGKEVFVLKNIFTRNNESNFVSWFYYPEELNESQFGVIPKLNDGVSEHSLRQIEHGLPTLVKMVELCLQSQSYRRIILSMIHTNIQPDYIRVVLYAVGLETITDLVYQENKDKMKPVSDKELAVEIRSRLTETLQQFATMISDSALKKFIEVINQINKPTNSEKLTRPFSIYGVPLIDNDLDAIKNRNDFLHGRLPYNPGSHELSIVGYRLQFCVNALVMKYCGYTGAVIYQASIFQREKKKKIDCPVYRII